MSTSQVLTVVGYAVGTYFGYPQLGAVVGGLVGSAIDASNVSYDIPKVGDMKAPQMQMGSPLLRLYGSNRTSGTLGWYSDKRTIPGDDGGKGDPSPPTAETAEIDMLFILAVDSDITAIGRVWRNGEVIWTNRADSDATSIANSATTDAWTSIDFLNGNPAQLPHPTIEASDGVGNVSAYKYRQCVLVTGLKLGQSGQIPLLEFEPIHGTVGAAAHASLLWDADNAVAGVAYGPSSYTVIVPIGGRSVELRTASGTSAPEVPPFDLPGDNASPNFVKGTADQPCIVWNNASGDSCYAYFRDPDLDMFVLGTYLLGGIQGANRNNYALRGDSFVFAALGGFSDNCIYHFHRDGALVGTSLPLATSSVAIGNGVIYAANNATLTELDPATMAVVTSYSIPGPTSAPQLMTNAEGRLWVMRSDELFERVSGSWVQISASLPTEIVVADSLAAPPTITGTTLYNNHGGQAAALNLNVVTPVPVDLADLVTAEWERVDDSAKIDVTDLVGIPVRGFQTGGSVRGAYEALVPIFHFGAACSDKLYFRLMGGAPKATLTFGELAAGEDKPADEPFAPERMNEEEIIERALLTCPDWSNDYNTTTQTGSRGTGTSGIVQTATTNVVMTPSECKGVAEIIAAVAGVSATTGQIALTDYHADKEPTDSLIVPDEDGNLHRVRIVRDTYGGGVHVIDWVLDDPQALVPVGVTSSGGGQALTVAAPPETELVQVDTAIFRDADDDPGYYAAAKGSPRYGSRLFNSPDNVSYTKIADFTAESVFGPCLTTMPDWTRGRVRDPYSTLRVNAGDGELASTTWGAIFADETVNAIAIKRVDGQVELCQFKTATLVSANPNVYDLSGFLRGSRGSEQISTGHTSGETFLLITAALRRIAKQTSELGVSEYYKAVSNGRLLSTANAVSFTDNGVGKKPYAPVHVRVLHDAATGDATINLTRRTRYSTRFASPLGIACPLSEVLGEVDVYSDGTYTTVVRTLSSATASFPYSASSQTADGLTPGATLHLRAYLINDIVNRGYATQKAA